MDTIYEYANIIWQFWLGIVFIGIFIITYWPSAKKKKEREAIKQIPLRDD